VILLTGIPRSRTSLTAAIFEACGANFGPKDDQIGPHPTNILGFFESQAARDQLQRPYFRKIGKDPLGRRPLPKAQDIIIEPDWRERFFRAVPGATAHKECKIILYWEQWHDAFPDAKWVLIRRIRDEIMESVTKRTPFMRGKLTQAQYEKWIDHHLDRIEQIKNCANLSWVEIETGDLMRGRFSDIRNAVEFSGLKWNINTRSLIRPDVTFIKN
jgi:hypothetical protein